jgi:predicted MPP superfamily phosphohydrolase
MKGKSTRRDFLKLTGRILLVAGIELMGGLIYANQLEPAWLDVVRVTLRLKRLPAAFSGFRIAQISDIHMGGWMNRARLERVVQMVLAEKPDVVAITGDYLLGGHGWSAEYEQALADAAAALEPLAASTVPVTVMGNHDHWTDVKKIRAKLQGIGIHDLSNHAMSISRGGESFYIGGVDSVYDGHDDLDQTLSQLPPNAPAILLCHEPDFADISAATGLFDLQISGHSHGGQVIIPFHGPIKTPKHGHKYPLGLYRVGEMFQYTNRGVGMLFPYVRFNCRPEITVFTLEAEEI